MTFTYRNGVSIAEVVVYVPSLAFAIYLTFRHGFGRSSGWYFLIIFCLARIVGPCMELATISNPTEVALYTGSSICQNIGLSPLMLATIGLLGRLIENINRSHRTLVNTHMIKLIELVVTVGLILGIIGGIDAATTFEKTGVYTPTSLSKASVALFIVTWVAIVGTAAILSFSVSHAVQGEKRILLAVALALPFLLVRLTYSCLATFTHIKGFNTLTGNVTILLCMALIEEFIVVVIFVSMGVTLQRVSKDAPIPFAQGHQTSASGDSAAPMNGSEKKSGGFGATLLKVAKMTIIGRIITMMIPDKRERDVEMQTGYARK